ncbi:MULTISPECIES: TdeIII family type II restriction endonuclease [unclassified Limnothrix]|uniref:TdeIII family type II restriction endonuclease n=1 Tax=unclassified Limnothrix TaxID=2632864 RepID=UPI0018F00A12|nr:MULTISPECIES: TdeIII family type II restriction endonuclease [unclassified Limnothrix]
MIMESSLLKAAIQQEIQQMMDRVLDNAIVKNPFIVEEHRAAKPLYAALVPDEIFKGSHFERRFVTPFGKVWERLALIVAQQAFGNVSLQQSIQGLIPKGRLARISETLNALEHKHPAKVRQKPNWRQELNYILKGKGELIPVSVTCDFWATSKDGSEVMAAELKAPLPNSDQTKVSKEKLFKLYAMEPCPVTRAYFALPYNPYGQKQNYAWSFPQRWFDMQNDPVVLIGDEFWNLLGGAGTYQALIEAVNEVGSEYKAKIYREFLGIDVPESPTNFQL